MFDSVSYGTRRVTVGSLDVRLFDSCAKLRVNQHLRFDSRCDTEPPGATNGKSKNHKGDMTIQRQMAVECAF